MKTREIPPAGASADSPVEPSTACRVDAREVARFLRPQPPLPIPERTRPQPAGGLLARSLLGDRVYKGLS